MTSKFLIYGLIDPRTDEVRYIGKSTSGLNRPKQHTMPSILKRTSHKTNWIRSLLVDGLVPIIRVLESFTDTECLEDAEMFWISQGKGMGWELTNLTKGGGGTVGWHHYEETKQRLRAVHSGKSYHVTKHGPDTRARISAAHLGRKHTDEARRNMRLAQLGKKHTIDHVTRQSESMKGVNTWTLGTTQSRETIEKRRAKLIGKKPTPEAMVKAWETRRRKAITGEPTRREQAQARRTLAKGKIP
jgi:hypothetical protein